MSAVMSRGSALALFVAAMVGCTATPAVEGNDSAPDDAEAAAAETKTAVAPLAEPITESVEPVRGDFWFSRDPVQGGLVLGRVPTGVSSVNLDGKALSVTPEGFFLMGFGRDAAGGASLRWTAGDGKQQQRNLSVRPGKWKIERVNLSLPRGRKASQRRVRELAAINGARSESHPSEGWRQDFIWPVNYREVAGGRISGLFGSQRYYRGTPGGYHTGLDIAAPTGTPYVAPADGVVTLATATPFSREGYLLMIDHGMGLNSAFVHSSKILVRKGDIVRQGQAIGLVGATGSATGPHLHWSMKWGSERVDPLLLVPPK